MEPVNRDNLVDYIFEFGKLIGKYIQRWGVEKKSNKDYYLLIGKIYGFQNMLNELNLSIDGKRIVFRYMKDVYEKAESKLKIKDDKIDVYIVGIQRYFTYQWETENGD